MINLRIYEVTMFEIARTIIDTGTCTITLRGFFSPDDVFTYIEV
ncbi:hypothetical protein [Lysinibacillus antri]|nr:hypothetical protein [Lysinibacillus antri]